MSGNYAQSYAAKLARVAVVAAYPITPQTSIVEKIAEFIADGQLKAQYINVESEHSAMQACISASAVGARTYTATSSQGLLLMHELLFWAAGQRAPVVMGVINRAIAPPWNIWTDHTDSMAQRDTGWIQFYAESNQEVLDTVLMAYYVAENPEVLLPAMVMEDAFYLSHIMEPVDLPEQGEVDKYLRPFDNPYQLDISKPHRLGSFVTPEFYEEMRFNISEGMRRARRVILQAEEDFRRRFGRGYGGLLPLYKTDGADAVMIVTGTAASTSRLVVDELRSQGKKVGLARLRVFRPFPIDEIRELGARISILGVLDRNHSLGARGATFHEVASALYNQDRRPFLKSYVGGLGGRDLTPKILKDIFLDLLRARETREELKWPTLKGLSVEVG